MIVKKTNFERRNNTYFNCFICMNPKDLLEEILWCSKSPKTERKNTTLEKCFVYRQSRVPCISSAAFSIGMKNFIFSTQIKVQPDRTQPPDVRKVNFHLVLFILLLHTTYVYTLNYIHNKYIRLWKLSLFGCELNNQEWAYNFCFYRKYFKSINCRLPKFPFFVWNLIVPPFSPSTTLINLTTNHYVPCKTYLTPFIKCK